jgi:hypothetical protein
MQAFARRLALATLMVSLILWAQSNPVSAQAGDPVIGTWKLDLTKSKYSPGPPPKSLALRFEAAGEGVKLTSDGVNAEGQPTHTEYTANYDGKDYPIAGSATADTVSLKRIDASTVERTDKKGGKIVETRTRKISSDGKMLTVAFKGTDAKGQPFNNMLVFERQP